MEPTSLSPDRSYEIEDQLLQGVDPYDPSAGVLPGLDAPAVRGGEAAHDWVVPAINGENVPLSARSEFSYVDIQGSHGSANIPPLQASCAAWYWHYRNNRECDAVLDAWRGYFALDRWHTKEPYGCFRYRNWITKSYVVMHALCQVRQVSDLEEQFSRYIKYMAFTAVLSAGWNRSNPGGSYNNKKVYPVAYAGSRSWVSPKNSQGHYLERPYQGLTDWNGISEDLSNIIGSATKAHWEVEPELEVLAARHSYARWNMFSSVEKQLMERLVKAKAFSEQVELDLAELSSLIVGTGAKTHITVHLIKTTQGTAFVSERSWSSGSTSFKMGAIWTESGRAPGEYPESWAEQIPIEWGWLHSGGHSRRSDPGGTGSLSFPDENQGSFSFGAETNEGSCANGFTPGQGKHYAQWLGWVTDRDAWPQGPRRITLDGDLVWHAIIKGKGRGVEIFVPGEENGGGGPVDPPVEPPPTEPPPSEGSCPPEVTGPGASDLVYAHDQLVRSMRNWGTNKGDNQSRRAGEAIDEARRKMYG